MHNGSTLCERVLIILTEMAANPSKVPAVASVSAIILSPAQRSGID